MASSGVRPSRCVFAHLQRHRGTTPAGSRSARQRRRCGRPADHGAVAALQRLDVLDRGDRDALAVAPRSSRVPNGRAPPPARPPRPSVSSWARSRCAIGAMSMAASASDVVHLRVLQLQEPQVHRRTRRRRRRRPSSRHCNAISRVLAEPASAAPGGPSTPNCQRTWFLLERPVGVEQVALVEHRVGDGAGRARRSQRRSWPAASAPVATRPPRQPGHRLLPRGEPVPGPVVGRARRARRGRAAASRCSGSSWSISSRHTATGSS